MEQFLDSSRIKELWVLVDVIIAIILTGVIGLEREMGNKPAGLKTNMMVGASAALLVSVGKILIEEYDDPGLLEHMEFDPLRLIQAIVVGVGFIGGGTILKSEKKEKVRYLTSAATILLCAGIGITVASQKYILAVGLTLIVFCINHLLGKLERKLGDDNVND